MALLFRFFSWKSKVLAINVTNTLLRRTIETMEISNRGMSAHRNKTSLPHSGIQNKDNVPMQDKRRRLFPAWIPEEGFTLSSPKPKACRRKQSTGKHRPIGTRSAVRRRGTRPHECHDRLSRLDEAGDGQRQMLQCKIIKHL